MNIKRLLGEGSEGGSEAGDNKRRRLSSNIFREVTAGRLLQEYVPKLEPLIQTWVREAVDSSFEKLSSSHDQIELSSVSRTWQLRFQSSISSSKVDLVVLDGEFNPDDHDEMGQQFDRKTVQNREGKRPLVSGELIVQLQEGVGHIDEILFTDNSSWIRSGKFRLGAKLHARSDRIRVREGISDAFKVKDHRGKSYEKLYPPSLDDEVWRLEKIAKDGPSHKKLEECKIHSVKDFLRLYFKNPLYLRSLLHNISNKMWATIVGHALTCPVDNKLYVFSTVQGTSLVFNSVHKVVGATFDGQNYHSLEKLDVYHVEVVEHLKQHAYDNSEDWVLVADPSIIGPISILLASAGESSFNNPSLDHTNIEGEHDYLETQMKVKHRTISFSQPYKGGEQYNSYLESVADQNQGTFNLALGNCFWVDNSPDEFLMGNGHTWASEDHYVGSQLLHQDLPADGRPSGGARFRQSQHRHNIF
ncbi:calmodulin-binding protein 60 B-like isoform X3 [Primulina eburnea]|uniref:calmodulin-binding protein 60 B-like isoform X3 n=1 Tax=Primulina eburnea TaxID=1245227 RepID=UPI003C6BF81C